MNQAQRQQPTRARILPPVADLICLKAHNDRARTWRYLAISIPDWRTAMDLTKTYANGQPVSVLAGTTLTFFYKSGQLKAAGPFVDGMMEGTWRFYRENGTLWQTGNFKNEVKHGRWTRYDREGIVEYDEEFHEGKKVKK
jgi:hypothetical protein